QLQAILDGIARTPPLYEVTAADGIVHTLWLIDSQTVIDDITKLVDAMPALYIADGHHRSAAASRIAAARRENISTDSHGYFLSVAFPHDQMKILDYNRVVRDLNG